MAATIRIVSNMLLFLGLISQFNSGYSQCSMNDISISQSTTGGVVFGRPEWNVTLINPCDCVQLNVKLNCRGFRSVQEIDPSILRVLGDACLVNGGQPVYRDPITFTYAWDTPFPLNPIYSEIACS